MSHESSGHSETMLFLMALSYLLLGICGAVCWSLLSPRKIRPPGGPSTELARRAPSRCYDTALRLLSEEQGEWYVNVILERELSNLYKFYSRHELESTAGRSSGRRFDDDEEIDVEESEESSSEPESEDSSSDEESEIEEHPRAASKQPKMKPPRGRNEASGPAASSATKVAPAKEELARGVRSRTGRRKKQGSGRSRHTQATPTQALVQAIVQAAQAPAAEAAASSSPSTASPAASAAGPAAARAENGLPAKPSAPAAPPRPVDWQKYVAASLAEDPWIQAAEDHTRATGKILEVFPPRGA